MSKTRQNTPPADRGTTDWHDRVSEIVVEALDLPADALEEFLRRACEGDEALLAEVRSLVAEDSTDDAAFLAIPAAEQLGMTPDEPTDGGGGPAKDPDQVGPYRIIKRLGVGGMGTVYLGQQQEPVERRVAIKLIRRLHSERARRRFQAECQALARLNHPNIASMYEVGTVTETPDLADGTVTVPYIAMEWVDGYPISFHCDLRRDTLRQRIELFLGVCAGVSHAHEKQVLHCDLKPSNVLVAEVDGQPMPKVIDFGISRALSDDESPEQRRANLTTGLFVGSPLYVSPEATAISGVRSLDTRSDVYSLGVLLFELLVGALPADPEEQISWALAHRTARQPAPAPSARFAAMDETTQAKISECRSTTNRRLRRTLRGDLDAIVLKAMAPEPSDRYASPAELAADLNRYLRTRPVRAGARDPVHRLRRFLSRNALATAVATLVLGAMTATLVARTREAQRANREAVRAQAALAESEQVREFVIGLFDAADPEEGGRGRTMEEALDRGFQRLQNELQDLPLARAELLHTIGTIYEKLALLARAETAYRQALQLRLSSLDATDEKVLWTRNYLGILLRKMRRYGEADEHLQAVLEARSGDPQTEPELLAMAHNHLGNLRWAEERFDEAAFHHHTALRIRTQNEVPAGSIAESANNLGVLLNSQGRDQEALPHLELAAEKFEQHFGPRHHRTSAALNNLGLVLRRTPRWREAPALFDRAADIWSELLGRRHPTTQFALRNQLSEHTRLHRWGEAVHTAEELVEVTREVEDQRAHPRAHRLLAAALSDAGRPTEAVTAARHAVELYGSSAGPDAELTLIGRRTLATVLAAAGEAEEALAEISEVAARLSEVSGQSDADWLAAERQRALILLQIGDTAQAVEVTRRLIDRREQAGGSPVFLAQALFDHGRALTAEAQFDDAVDLLIESRKIRAAIYGDSHPTLFETDVALAEVLATQGYLDNAVEVQERAVRSGSGFFPDDDAALAAARLRLGELERLAAGDAV